MDCACRKIDGWIVYDDPAERKGEAKLAGDKLTLRKMETTMTTGQVAVKKRHVTRPKIGECVAYSNGWSCGIIANPPRDVRLFPRRSKTFGFSTM